MGLRSEAARQRAQQRLETLVIRDAQAWSEYAAFCDAYRDGAMSSVEYEEREPREWHRLKAALNARASERAMLLLEVGVASVDEPAARYVDTTGRRS